MRWERVQGALTGRHATPIRSYGYEFAFSGRRAFRYSSQSVTNAGM